MNFMKWVTIPKAVQLTGKSERTIRRFLAGLPAKEKAKHTKKEGKNLLVNVGLFGVKPQPEQEQQPEPEPEPQPEPAANTAELDFLRNLTLAQQHKCRYF